MKHFTQHEVLQATRKIYLAQLDLGILSNGQKIDLLLDNFSFLQHVEDARDLLAQVDQK